MGTSVIIWKSPLLSLKSQKKKFIRFKFNISTISIRIFTKLDINALLKLSILLKSCKNFAKTFLTNCPLEFYHMRLNAELKTEPSLEALCHIFYIFDMKNITHFFPTLFQHSLLNGLNIVEFDI